jgi:hypothetical protein
MMSADIPASSAGFDHGELETRHAGNLAEIAHDATEDEDAGGKERSRVHLLADIRRLTAANERLQAQLSARGSSASVDNANANVPGRHAGNRAEIQRLMAEIERLQARLEVELSVNDTGVQGSSGTSSSVRSPVAMLAIEALDLAAEGEATTVVVPFADDPPMQALTDGRSDPTVDRPGCSPMDTSAASVATAGGEEWGGLVHSLAFLRRRMGLVATEHDRAWREAMVNQMRNGGQSYSEEEAGLIAKATDMLDNVAKITRKGRPVKHAKTVQLAQTKYDKRKRQLVGHVKLFAPASPEDVVAFLMHFDSQLNESRRDPEVDVRDDVLEVKNLHHSVVLIEQKTAPFHNRIFLNRILWQKIADSPLRYIWAGMPVECHDKLQAGDEVNKIRATAWRVLRLTLTPDSGTMVEYVCALDFKGHMPRWFSNAIAIPRLMHLPYTLQTYFLEVKPRADFTAKDGVLLGSLLADAAEGAPPHELASAITKFVLRTTVLLECELVFFDAMITALFAPHFGLAKFRTVFAQPVSTADPANLTAAECTTIGTGLDALLRTSTDHMEAVALLLLTYPAMDEMAKRHEWARPMLETIALRRMAAAPFGLKLRLTIGALLSMGDMASDIFNLVTMFGAGQSVGAYALLAMILTTLTLQIVIVVIQNAHHGSIAVFKEVLLVLSLCKAGVDALRVARGEGHVAGAPIDPLTEMMMCKLLEMVFESIPGGLLQAIFILFNGMTTAALLSILLSCLSTAFTATMIAYDLDTNAAKRKSNPEFFGYACPASACMRP